MNVPAVDEGSAVRAAILDLLAEHTVMTLAVRRGAFPHAVSLFYASRGLELYWVSDPGTRHSAALAADPRAAVTIARQYEQFEAIRGLQMTGHGRRVRDASVAAALDVLTARFPFFGPLRAAAAAGSGPLATAVAYRFDPRQVTYIDNTRGFGFKRTLDL